ncbi:radical SAM protein [Pseudoalteromonas sp. S1608]|uniref:B12-binding domain-containing radical SAM protein n=1 Tax=Pseudoalteromonas sp. S1608 TaxID=579504 RepID=UPI00110A4F8E|nr:radical SAM protein [Pseudoalteromonas sp. S1608]TMP73676.1 radical SAM protein [Pseudoalteromonas sp. S1608]
MSKIFCISAGQLITKKTDHIIHRKNRYLNYGLLSLATVLKNNGFESIQIQGGFDDPNDTFNTSVSLGLLASEYPILISIPSFYAVSWVNSFINLVKKALPQKKIIIGGRWVIDDEVTLMKELIPLADIIFPGTAEEHILKLITNNPLKSTRENAINQLDYSLLHERHLFQPNLEVSRGCGMGCNFCQEKDEKLTVLKSPKLIVSESHKTILVDNLTPMNLYFEASLFASKEEWIDELIKHRQQTKQSFKWRTEARVDSIKVSHLKKLKLAGLEIIDLGLESANFNQLINMNKTKKPEKYLSQASRLIEEAYKNNIKVKVNILLFAGENEESIASTISWLDKHQDAITGVSVGPVIVFGWQTKIEAYLNELSLLGASVSHQPITGITHLDLSSTINYKSSIDISKYIGQRYTTSEDYFYLKSFSYFARDYTFEQFNLDCKGIEDQLNFRLV